MDVDSSLQILRIKTQRNEIVAESALGGGGAIRLDLASDVKALKDAAFSIDGILERVRSVCDSSDVAQLFTENVLPHGFGQSLDASLDQGDIDIDEYALRLAGAANASMTD